MAKGRGICLRNYFQTAEGKPKKDSTSAVVIFYAGPLQCIWSTVGHSYMPDLSDHLKVGKGPRQQDCTNEDVVMSSSTTATNR
jgi:hypothetical protein